MQVIYTLHKDENYNLPKGERALEQSLEQTRELYATLMAFWRSLYQRVQEIDITSEQKLLLSGQEKQKNKVLLACEVFKELAHNEALLEFTEQYAKVNWQQHNEFISLAYTEILHSKVYAKFLKINSPSFDQQKYLLSDLYTHVIAPNEKLFAFLEDQTLTWAADFPIINTLMVHMLKGLTQGEQLKLTPSLFKDDQESLFASELLRKTVLSDEQNQKYLVEKTPQWDTQRLASIDAILIKMAITEFLKFPSIPIKVTINEYVEIAKEYSTAKSGLFVNGILDNLSKDLTAQGKIQKIGRGLY